MTGEGSKGERLWVAGEEESRTASGEGDGARARQDLLLWAWHSRSGLGRFQARAQTLDVLALPVGRQHLSLTASQESQG